MKDIATIVLAAGASRRLGRPKQLVEVDGMSLLARTIKIADEAQMENRIVVTGARRELIERSLAALSTPLEVVFNPDWQAGMSTSIVAGIEYIQQQHPDLKGALFLVCDQPALQADIIREVVRAFDPERAPIVRCQYTAGYGPPVCFSRSFFPELLQLKGDLGARAVIKNHPELCTNISFPAGDWDIDTEEDLRSGGKIFTEK